MVRRVSTKVFGRVRTTVGNVIVVTTLLSLAKSERISNTVEAEVDEDAEVVDRDIVEDCAVEGVVDERVFGNSAIANDPFTVIIFLKMAVAQAVVVVPALVREVKVEVLLDVETCVGRLRITLVVCNVTGGNLFRTLT